MSFTVDGISLKCNYMITDVSNDPFETYKINPDTLKSALPEYAGSVFCVQKDFWGKYNVTRLNDFFLEFNVPVILSRQQALTLKIDPDTRESKLPKYAGSIFYTSNMGTWDTCCVLRLNKTTPPSLNGKTPPIFPLKGRGENNYFELQIPQYCADLIAELNVYEYTLAEQERFEEHQELKEIRNILIYFYLIVKTNDKEFQAGGLDFLNLIHFLNLETQGHFNFIFNKLADHSSKTLSR